MIFIQERLFSSSLQLQVPSAFLLLTVFTTTIVVVVVFRRRLLPSSLIFVVSCVVATVHTYHTFCQLNRVRLRAEKEEGVVSHPLFFCVDLIPILLLPPLRFFYLFYFTEERASERISDSHSLTTQHSVCSDEIGIGRIKAERNICTYSIHYRSVSNKV